MHRKAPPRGQPPVPQPTPPGLLDAHPTADLVTLPARRVLALAGSGPPSCDSFHRGAGAIYGIAYSIKFSRRARNLAADFEVGPLEVRFWTESPDRSVLESPPATWHWCLRLTVPDDVAAEDVTAAVKRAVESARGKLADSAEARRIALEEIPGGPWARILHVGPYAAQGRSLDKIGAFLSSRGLAGSHGHVEVSLGDPTRTSPDRLKAVLLVEVRGAAPAQPHR